MSATSAAGLNAATLAKAKRALGCADNDHAAAIAALGEVYAMPGDVATAAVARAAIPKLRRTDYGNAERLVYHHGRELRFVSRWRTWLVWDGRRQPVEDGVADVDEFPTRFRASSLTARRSTRAMRRRGWTRARPVGGARSESRTRRRKV